MTTETMARTGVYEGMFVVSQAAAAQFREFADDEAAQRFSSNLPLERMHAALDGDHIVGGAGAFPFELTVPGGTVGCGGVTVVGVLPTHRRRGVLTAMMERQLHAAYIESGDYTKFRELSVRYNVPERMAGRFAANATRVSSAASEPTASRNEMSNISSLPAHRTPHSGDLGFMLVWSNRSWSAVSPRHAPMCRCGCRE